MGRQFTRVATSLIMVASFLGGVQADPIYQPPGLNPGDMYQLIFVTSSTLTAGSNNIADYNGFVSDVADEAGIGPTMFSNSPTGAPIEWTVVGSTADNENDPAVDAIDNAPQLAPVYNTQGDLVASGDFLATIYDTFFPGRDLSNPVNYDENGDLAGANGVFTGTNSLGTGGNILESALRLGEDDPAPFPGPLRSTIGSATAVGKAWLNQAPGNQDTPLPFYALSQKLTVESSGMAAPEPSSVLTWVIVVCAGFLSAVRRPNRMARGRQ